MWFLSEIRMESVMETIQNKFNSVMKIELKFIALKM